MSIQSMASTVRTAMNERIAKESRAFRGLIRNGRLLVGKESLSAIQAVECNTSNGRKVWAQRTRYNSALIVGA